MRSIFRKSKRASRQFYEDFKDNSKEVIKDLSKELTKDKDPNDVHVNKAITTKKEKSRPSLGKGEKQPKVSEEPVIAVVEERKEVVVEVPSDTTTLEKYFRNYSSETLVSLKEPKFHSINSLDELIWIKVFSHVDSQSLKNAAQTCRLLYQACTPHLWRTLWIEIKQDPVTHNGLRIAPLYKNKHQGKIQCVCECIPRLLHQCRCESTRRVILITNSNIRHVLKYMNNSRAIQWFKHVRNVVAFIDDSTPTTEWNILPPNLTTEALKWFVDQVIPEQCPALERIELNGGYTTATNPLLQVIRKVQSSLKNQEIYNSSDNKKKVAVDLQLTLGHKTLLYAPLFLGFNVVHVDLQVFNADILEFAQLPFTVKSCRLRIACVARNYAVVETDTITTTTTTANYLSPPQVTCNSLTELFEPCLDLTTLSVDFSGEFHYNGTFTWIPKSCVDLNLSGDHCGGSGGGGSSSNNMGTTAIVSLPYLQQLKINGKSMIYVLASLHCPELDTLSVYNIEETPVLNNKTSSRNLLNCKSLSLCNCGIDATQFILDSTQSGINPKNLKKLSWRIRESLSGRELSDLLNRTRFTLSMLTTLYLHFVVPFPSINKPLILDEIATCCKSLQTCCIWDHDDQQYFVFFATSRNWTTHTLK